jgi:hypothetical protein
LFVPAKAARAKKANGAKKSKGAVKPKAKTVANAAGKKKAG